MFPPHIFIIPLFVIYWFDKKREFYDAYCNCDVFIKYCLINCSNFCGHQQCFKFNKRKHGRKIYEVFYWGRTRKINSKLCKFQEHKMLNDGRNFFSIMPMFHILQVYLL